MPRALSLDVRTRFFDLICEGGLSSKDAASAVGASKQWGELWWRKAGGMKLRDGRPGGLADPAPVPDVVKARALTGIERGQIQVMQRLGWPYRRIGEAIGRDKSVVWREVDRNRSDDGNYYATLAHARAHQRRRRPKPFKLIDHPEL